MGVTRLSSAVRTCCCALVVVAGALGASATPAAAAPCDPPIANEIACENSKPGNPPSEWDINGAGDPEIQGFATDLSVDQGDRVDLKIDSVTDRYRIDIYRLGWYGGLGARRVATVDPPADPNPGQPNCLNQSSTGLIDCGNWSVSASWNVPEDAVTGIYVAKLVREDEPGASHIVFVVRDDDGGSEIVMQTSDTTWQAYNRYGGNSLYTGSPAGRAYKVSYNRPFTTREYAAEDWLFNAEYPMLRWLERNGYDVSYITGIDADRSGAELREHETFVSIGHDEYWSGNQRANVEAARAAGVNLAFLSGNEVFWKTRWEPSIDGSNTPHRTLVSYKETHAGAKIDPEPNIWTGTWRDPRFSPPADGGQPENALTGQLFRVNDGATTAIQVPAADGRMRIWRDTSIAQLQPGQMATLAGQTLGYEWDEDPDNGHRPAGAFRVSSTTVQNAPILIDHGSTYGQGTATHNMTLYRHASGALVFGAGTVQWAWGLDDEHDRSGPAPDSRMQQATANLLADMGALPATPQPGLVPPTPSTDSAAPSSEITAPANNAELERGNQVTITGTASDAGGGVVGGVEVSVDGGATWRRADGRGNWTFNWTPSESGTYTIRSRAVDDTGNLESPGAGVTVTVPGSSGGGMSLWDDSVTPAIASKTSDSNAVELGVKFRPAVDGRITALRFYKGATNTGTHVGHLWSRGGQLLAQATFTNETASGWQRVELSNPVEVTAGTTYVASYHAPNGNYAINDLFFAAGSYTNGALTALGDGVDGGNGVYAYGPSGSFPSNTWQASNYWVDVEFEPATGGDTTPPQVSNVSPADGANDVSPGTNVTATFNEPVDPATVNGNTFELRGPGGATVNATVTYDAVTRTATLDPASALTDATTYTATVRGGGSGVKDLAGNALLTDRAWTFTTASTPPGGGGGCPCSIWDDTATPESEAETTDANAVELGVKFRPTQDGRITGIRFFKGQTNTGTHVGHLWSRTGQLLAEATFTNESPRGWQEVTFSNPVDVTAGTTYIASYHAPNGNYAYTRNYFATSGVDNGPLSALAAGVDGGNGVYAYGPSRSFPSNTWESTHYWVDVVFETNAPDTTPPTVTATSPAADATDVDQNANVTATFNEPLDPATVNGNTFELRGPGGAIVPASVSWDADGRSAVLNPESRLADETTYSATVRGGPNGVADRSGNRLANDRTWSFTTAGPPPPPPDEGPGGPIVAITSGQNPFSRYYAEILRAEGLNEFTTRDISNLTATNLAQFDVAILGDIDLTAAQVTMLTNWVNAGGNLIAMRPDPQLAGLLGLSAPQGTLSNAYLRIDTSRSPGAGLVGETIQFHGTADRYTASNATTLATLYSNANTPTSNPALTLRSVGSNGGQAAAFSIDVARSVVYTRQGNPAWAGQERDGVAPIRSDDLFFGGSQADWVDLNKVAIPQADELQRLVANLIGEMNDDRKPLPRFWYLPRGERAAVVMTGDDHARNGTAGRFDIYRGNSPPGCSVAQWECVRATSYIFPDTPISNTAVNAAEADGFEIGLHLNTGCADFTPASLQANYADQLAALANRFPSLPAPTTNRTHCITWSDWATQPKIELQHGIRFDTNYYYWPPDWVANRPGFFTGSGMPMRFADLDGTMIDVYQATTQMTDESGQTFPFTINTLLDRALGSEGYYGAFTANMHTDDAVHPGSSAIVSSALSRGVPIVSAEQMLSWIDGRNASSFGSLIWNGSTNTLSFTIDAASGANGLQAMLPVDFGSRELTEVRRGGTAVPFTTQTIKGVEYAVFAATDGSYQASYGSGQEPPPPGDTTPPTISGVSATAAPNGTATVTWTTNEPADSRVDYGTQPDNLNASAGSAALTSQHNVQITGLTPGATYHFRVRSADAAGNASTSPAPPAAPATFGVPEDVSQAPAATTIETGTAAGGNVASLSADDNNRFRVTAGGSLLNRVSSWYGSFTGVTNALSNLRVDYRGRNTSSCTQTVAIWRWTTNSWETLDSRSVGSSEVGITNLAPSGNAADYVSGSSGDGEVRVRVRCQRTSSFTSEGDLMRITYRR